MMKIKADQELKSMEEKIKGLSSNYMDLKGNVERLENHLNNIKTNNAIISQTPNNPRKHIDLHSQNAEYYHLLEMPESRKQEYFYSATSAATEMQSISNSIEIMMGEKMLSWRTVAIDGLASFASGGQDNLDKLNELINVGKLMVYALEYGRIPPKELTDEMVSSLKFAYKAAYGVGVYHFGSENKEKVLPQYQKSIDYIFMAIKFDAYYSLNKECFDDVCKDIMHTLERYSKRYDMLISDIESRKEFFDDEAEKFLSKLKDNAVLKATAIGAHRS